jgi:hypothetical protein
MTHHHRVTSPRNSVVGTGGVTLADLDWSQWWTDGIRGHLYLHVPHLDGDTIHRVYCRRTDTPRLQMRGGELYWLVDKEASE